MTMEAILKAVETVEGKLISMTEKAEGEMKTLGKVSADTKAAIDNLGVEQRALADRMLAIEQKSTQPQNEGDKVESVGEMFTKSADYGSYVTAMMQGAKPRIALTVKNTITNAVGNTFSDRRPGIIGGALRIFTIEDLLNKLPTSSNAIDYVRENVFTNSAAETAEGAAKPQSSLTFTQAQMPVSTIAHWLKITKQLAADNAALAAYVNTRMVYGVNLRTENQLVVGNGTAPNLSGLTNAGNFTAHGYTDAALVALGGNKRIGLIGKMIGDCAVADYPADTIILNTADWWTLRLQVDAQGRYLLGDPASNVAPVLFGLPVVASNAMPADNVWVGSLSQAATMWNREGVSIGMFEQDENNVQLNLITIRAERRCALTVERPSAARYGDLTPA